MFNFIMGLFLGIYVATHGVSGFADAFEKSIDTVKSVKITTENK